MIIGLSGYARSGKDTVASFLVSEYAFERISFADPIRDILYALNPSVDGESLISMVDNYGWEIAKSKKKSGFFFNHLDTLLVPTFIKTFGLWLLLVK